MRKAIVLVLLAGAAWAEAPAAIPLPKPNTTGGMPLMQALNARKSEREFSPEKLSPQALSNLLWAAYGVNRPDGRRTAPSANNRQTVDVYVALPEGAYLYNAKEHRLDLVVAGDLRAATGLQPFVAQAPVDLVYVADYARMAETPDTTRMLYSAVETGSIGQNVYLYCASEGLSTVIRAMVNRDALAKALKLRPEQKIMLSQTVGYPPRAPADQKGASSVDAQTSVVMLWPNGAPGSENWTQKEAEYAMGNSGAKGVRNVVKPSITAYLPPAGTATGAAVIVAPGGAFRFLSWDAEGTMVADWLQQRGVAVFVLKYRLADTGTDAEFAQSQARGARSGTGGAGRCNPPAAPGNAGRGGAPGAQSQIREMAAADGLQAVKVVREHAAEWHIDPDKIGLMGFSAGGYVAVKAAYEHTTGTRPSFVASIYGCCINPADIKVPDDAPPIFFLHAYNDPVSASSPALFLAWKAADKPAELHTFAAGGHGFGMPKHNLPTDGWIERFGDWLRYQKLMK